MTELEKKIKAKIPGEDTGIEIKRSLCAICSPGLHCGVDCYVKDGKILRIEGTPEHPFNHGKLCTKGSALRNYVYRADRLKTPLKRVGERGSGQWEEITWDQAFDEMAERLADLRDKYGAETLCFLEGTYRTQSNLHYKFTNLFGTPNTGGNGTICYSSDMWLEPCTYGGFCSDKSDWKRADLVVLWGRNPAASELLNWQWTLRNLSSILYTP